MAYLDLDNAFSAPGMSRTMVAKAPVAAGFSALEWSVIALAKRDTLRSLARPSRLSRAMGSLFGFGVASALADPRLEALRRLAVHAWHRGFALPVTEVEQFVAAGFAAAQVETLVMSVTGLRIVEA
ncbi:hypothetical protein ASG67_06695 [Sphingomonas sp. Leaf339]|uniref:hypothetical protein n=1 Tax=Sphingomonas sp. Leaf339 TaxID=1736343 RepID=UPI0006F47870|nr:hypothetical protein [Sphingomonas sp. Leaf339]KQU55797.1 hypothetical protein ASG67_06695 [Sphingomonas sp. Leaf339]